MKTNWKWILGAVVILAVLIALPVIFRSTGYVGMMGGWHQPMMGRNGYLPFGGFMMGFGMPLMWILPLGLVLLLVYGVVRLATQPGQASAPAPVCSSCGKPTHVDWKNCPYCGKEL